MTQTSSPKWTSTTKMVIGLTFAAIFAAMVMGNLVHTSTVMLRRAWAQQLGGFPVDRPIGEDDDSNLGDFIEDTSVVSPAHSAASAMLRDEVSEVLKTLTPREAKVIRLRFGLTDDGAQRTLEEVGAFFNVTRERIRQIEAKALRKLRHPSRSRKLKDYLE